mgnify:CR=1 FL=1
MAKTIATAKVIGQKVLNSTIKILEVHAPEIASQAVPGQFVNVQVCKNTAPLLRRPFGVAGVNKEAGTFTIIYRIIGEATHILADVCSGDELSIVGPLGKGFDMTAQKPLLVGGGLGLAPLKFLAEGFGAGKTDILMGGRTKEEIVEKYLETNYSTVDSVEEVWNIVAEKYGWKKIKNTLWRSWCCYAAYGRNDNYLLLLSRCLCHFSLFVFSGKGLPDQSNFRK